MADVLTVSAEKGEGKILFSGINEDGVLAVSCSLKDKNGEEIDFNSVKAEDGRFSGEFSNIDGGETVVCANYDGGEVVTATIAKDEKGTNEGKVGKDEKTVKDGGDGKVKKEIKEITPDAAETSGDESIGSSDTGFFTKDSNGFAQVAIGVAVAIAIVLFVLVFRSKRKKNV